MDTSISKALIMVAGILLAMIIIGFATYTFQHLSSWSTTQEDEYETQEAQKFNKEYEAYQKDLMYGVDVISCLNKAQSNNLKVDSGMYDSEYVVTVNIKFKTPLSETVEVYYLPQRELSSTTNTLDVKKEIRAANGLSSRGLKIKSGLKMSKSRPDSDEGVFYLSEEYKNYIKPYKESSCKIKYDAGLTPETGEELKMGTMEHTLELPNSPRTSELLKALLEVSKVLRQVEKNEDYKPDTNNWTRVVWENPVYSMKKKKFKCTGISYNSKTGRVNEINFEEF